MLSLAMLLDLAFKSAVLLALTFLLAQTLRRAPAATRHLLFFFAFVGLLLLPFLTALLPAWRILPQINSPPASSAQSSPLITTLNTAPQIQMIPARPPISAPAINPSTAISFSNQSNLPALLYSFGVAFFVAPLLLAALALRRLKRRATPLQHAPWPQLLSTTHQTLATPRTVALLLGDQQLTMPMAWGLMHSLILLPHNADTWSPDRRRIVLLHELAHLKRRDPLIQTLARIIAALYWFNPMIWFALRQLKIEAEHACDDLVLASTAPSTYASELLAIATSHRPHHYLHAATAMVRANNTQLHARIRILLDPTRNRTTSSLKSLFFLAAVILTVTLPVAMLHAADAPLPPANNFTHILHFQLGESQFLPGDAITITEVRGADDDFTLGNTLQITGTYTLASADHATLAAFITSLPGADPNHHDPIDPHQSIKIGKGKGTFSVILPLLSTGRPHLSFYPDSGHSSSALYFGAGHFLDKLGDSPRSAATGPLTIPSNNRLVITVHNGKVRVEIGGGEVFEADSITFTPDGRLVTPTTRSSP